MSIVRALSINELNLISDFVLFKRKTDYVMYVKLFLTTKKTITVSSTNVISIVVI